MVVVRWYFARWYRRRIPRVSRDRTDDVVHTDDAQLIEVYRLNRDCILELCDKARDTPPNSQFVVCWFNCHNREPSGSLNVPYVGLQQNRDSKCHTVPHTLVATVQRKTVSVRCLIVTIWIDQNWNSGPVESLGQSQTQRGCQSTGMDWPNHEKDHQQPPIFSSPILHT